ncbi:NACHT domain-containing protein [Nonomuraea fuscirosea]|uniref:NACHT domain-containing protein n=1 Tax=Nonomuraea fuscirosea TaxID=1291556 RepID=UPI0037955ECE
MGRTLAGAALLVAAGVAVNQILEDGKLSWSWGYLALVFTVLGTLIQAGLAPGVTSHGSAEARPIRRTRRGYLRQVRSSADHMETIGLVTQAEFVLRARQVYVDVKLQPRTVPDTATDSGIGPAAPPDKSMVGLTGRRASLASFLITGRVLAVLGAAGSGKTTLARYTALELAERQWRPWRRQFWRRRRIPVLLYLRDHADAILADKPQGLAQVAVHARWLDGVTPPEWLERRLAHGRCVVLLDGLDEVADAEQRNRVVHWIEAQISRYPGNSFVITSRPLGYEGNRLTSADVLLVQRFTNDQIHAFLHAWYRAIERRARQGDRLEIDRIAATSANDLLHRIIERPALYDLAANPLLLTMIANVHRYRGSLPGSRAALYEEMCQVLLHRRQEAKNLTTDELGGLDGDKKERIVQELALHMMREKLRDVSIEEATRAIRSVLKRTGSNITPPAFVAHVRRSGLLLESQHQRYGFAHLTLQEYLAAALIASHPSRLKWLTDNVSDPWWRETTLLWAARADASPVVQACLEKRTVPALHLAFACAAEARELDPALRSQLDQLLSTTPADQEQIRLLDGVAAARALQDTHTLDEEGTRICAHPVPDDLWSRYSANNDAGLIFPARSDATGPWTADVVGLIRWLNDLSSDISFRLPTTAEAQNALSNGIYPSTTIMWINDEVDSDALLPRLFSSNPDLHPNKPTPSLINAYPELILNHIHLILRILFPRSSLTPINLLAYSRQRDLARPRDQLLQTLDIGRAILLARDTYLTQSGARAHALLLARDLASDLALVSSISGKSHTAVDFVSLARTVDVNSASSLDSHHALSLTLRIAQVIADDYDRTPERALARTILRARDSITKGGGRIDANITRDLDFALDWVLRDVEMYASTLNPGRARPRGLAEALDDTLNRCIKPPGGPEDQILALAKALDRLTTPAPNRIRPHLRDCDLAFARAIGASKLGALDSRTLALLGEACLELLRCCAGTGSQPASGPQRRRLEETGIPLSDFLRSQLAEASSIRPADDPVVALKFAQRLAMASGASQVDTLIYNALDLTKSFWDNSQPVDQSYITLAATSILAAITKSEELALESLLPLRLREALLTLIAFTPNAKPSEPRAPEKRLILIRC